MSTDIGWCSRFQVQDIVVGKFVLFYFPVSCVIYMVNHACARIVPEKPVQFLFQNLSQTYTKHGEKRRSNPKRGRRNNPQKRKFLCNIKAVQIQKTRREPVVCKVCQKQPQSHTSDFIYNSRVHQCLHFLYQVVFFALFGKRTEDKFGSVPLWFVWFFAVFFTTAWDLSPNPDQENL